jgi:hypothetical protein
MTTIEYLASGVIPQLIRSPFSVDVEVSVKPISLATEPQFILYQAK